MPVTISQARTALAKTKLPDVAHFAADGAVAGMGMPNFDASKSQSVVIGSDVVSFGTGVEAEFRQAITDSALYAQLAALHIVGAKADPMTFFDAYFAKLMELGWLVQSRETSKIAVDGAGLDVHQAILGVITTFLAPIAGAAAAVLAVLEGLHKMNSDAPFITLFNQRSTSEKVGKFQFTFVRPDPAKGLLAEMAAFGLNADEKITQILFFKIHKGATAVHRSLGSLSIDPKQLSALRPNLAAKVLAYRQSMVAAAELGPVD